MADVKHFLAGAIAPGFIVLTYDAPHRKTQDLLMRLKAYGETDVQVVAAPWVARKNFTPLLPHRPALVSALTPETLARNLGFHYRALPLDALSDFLSEAGLSVVLIAGAGLLPAEVVERFVFINAHPGWIPLVRGLDALKWAILEDLPVGVTLHRINAETDGGTILRRIEVPLYESDAFHAFAYRQYEMEIDLLAQSPALLRAGNYTPEEAVIENVAFRRTPHALEAELLTRFEARKRKNHKNL